MTRETPENLSLTHIPVLFEEVCYYLASSTPATLVDSTLGEGGHSALLLERNPLLRIIGIDRDEELLARAKNRLSLWGDRISFFHGWSEDFFNQELNPKPQRILFDLGISMYHYLGIGRGFTFHKEQPLDMRLNPNDDKSVAELLEEISEEELTQIISLYGEDPQAKEISRLIIGEREKKPIKTTTHLANLIANNIRRKGKNHPATQTFQALRIAVNKELKRLENCLPKAFNNLEKDGIMAVISFHSLEDRIVKTFFKNLDDTQKAKRLNKKVIIPSYREKVLNPASRSSKLRVIKKI